MIKKLYQAITGKPWTTSRSCTHDFGPTPGARYAAELATFTNAQLLTMTRDEAITTAQLIRAYHTTTTNQHHETTTSSH